MKMENINQLTYHSINSKIPPRFNRSFFAVVKSLVLVSSPSQIPDPKMVLTENRAEMLTEIWQGRPTRWCSPSDVNVGL